MSDRPLSPEPPTVGFWAFGFRVVGFRAFGLGLRVFGLGRRWGRRFEAGAWVFLSGF